MSAEEAQTFLSGLDVCFRPLQTLPEAFEDANMKARGSILRDELGRRPHRSGHTLPQRTCGTQPALGEHNDAVLGPVRGRKQDAA